MKYFILITLIFIQETLSFSLKNNNRLLPEVETKTILSQKNGYGFLSTLNRKSFIKGYPYGSIVAFCLDELDNPYFIFSNLALHTRNILQNNSVSLCVTEYGFKQATDSRVTLVGNLVQKDDNNNFYKNKFLEYHPNADWITFPDFKVYLFDEIKDISFVGGFGRATKIKQNKYYSANKDPFIFEMDEIIEYFNKHYYRWMLNYINNNYSKEVNTFYVKNIDSKGINIICNKSEFIRFQFNFEPKTFEQLKVAIVEILLG